jgi:antitoxin component HigA of HigAB toxin-antitoxin module
MCQRIDPPNADSHPHGTPLEPAAFRVALARIEQLIDAHAARGTPEGDELDMLATLAVEYEAAGLRSQSLNV